MTSARTPHNSRHDFPREIPSIRDVVGAFRDSVPFDAPFGGRFGDPFGGRRFAGRAPERSIRSTIVSLLAEQALHGHQVISTISERSEGEWEPAAAEVYPTLQLLVDEGLATVEEQDGRRLYLLTEAGREEAESLSTAADDKDADAEDADDAADGDAPWSRLSSFSKLPGFSNVADFAGAHGELPKAGAKLGQAVQQVGLTGTEEQRARVAALLDQTRRNIYGILAEEPAAEDAPENTTATDDA
ncbi:MAG TPA: PadR family transcriptional regulator [Candidatus Corynebacterium avicola]|uniref:PadR family transcriptional regulator n=1 Tax=Candidatus Corynebacterium avicola TaxID=2838527 RepID=A0A9D1RNV6_9CORY|nr:PadR family transcriptional regulator [Candidatus Corynebacterium avicola]